MANRTPEQEDLLEELLRIKDDKQRFKAMETLRPAERRGFQHVWELWSRREQRAPEGDWQCWLISAGRGFGKTRAGAEWVREYAKRHPDARIALVGASLAETRAVMVEGESGLLAIAPPDNCPVFEPSLRRVQFGNGAQAFLYSAGEPESLRGPQHDAAPSGYVEGSTKPLASRVIGWAELSELDCQGERAMLAIGDVLLPPHGEHMCTAYDDSFNQTPARLIRTMTGLGYRGRVVHYVGMSHYYRLWPFGNGFHAAYNGDLCRPARAWHAAYFESAVAAGFAPIVSLSYELLAQNCPDWFKQKDRFGRFAQTGWDPPSSLLSPTSDKANAFLQKVAVNFVALLEAGGGQPLFQIGEPWWWVDPGTGAPCLSAKAFFGNALRWIDTMRGPLPDGATRMLDMAGTALAQSTAALAQAVRDAASAEAEILLLAFTPTILDPAMPELRRACLPVEWAWPAFDRLQIEDYDWLTQGAEGARQDAYDLLRDRLGYPVEATDYFSGFVLLPEDADRFWPLIDGALDEARQRGISQRYVWALPQVARDGYTRLPYLEDDVQAFDDVSYPLALGRDAAVSPEFSTSVAVTASGHERRNALWSDARLRYDVGPGIRSERELGTLLAFFRARHGPARGFRFRDPYDFSSHAMIDAPGPGDQPLGTGDGGTTRYQLAKYYGEQRRTITRPRSETIRISVDGIETTGFTYEGKGWIRFEVAPAAGADIRAGFEFDVPVRFAEDRLDVSGTSFAAGEAPSVPLVELREDA